MQNIRIEAVTIQEGKNKIQFNYEETRQGVTQIVRTTRTSKFAFHDDCQAAINKMKEHFVLLTEIEDQSDYKNLDQVSALPLLEDLTIKKIKFTDKGTVTGVVITAQRVTKDGHVFDCPTPFTNFDPDTSEYGFMDELVSDCDSVKQQLVEYLNGKFSLKGTQLSLSDAPQSSAA